jgi:hypothetical protein
MAETRKCIGSARFGIEPHDAPIEDFPSQPSQKDGLGRMCKTHWNQYTAGLARDAKARKAAAEGATEAGDPEAVVTTDGPHVPAGDPPPKRARRPKAAASAEEGAG